MHRRRRELGWALPALSVCIAVLGGVAFACTNLATLNLSSSAGRPGEAITVTGTGFMASADEMPMDGMAMDMSSMGPTTTRLPVTIRWNGPDGPVLSEAIPDKSGTVSVIFDIPDTAAGHYTVVAVQKNLQGYDVYGTPARAPIQVLGPGRKAAGLQGAGTAGGAGQGPSGGALALTIGLGVLGVGLFGAGGLAAARMVRVRRGVPAKVDGRRD